MFSSAELSRSTRLGIVLTGALLGGLLWFTGLDQENRLLATETGAMLYWRTLGAAFAVTLILLVQRFKQWRCWWLALLPLPPIALMTGWVNWNSVGVDPWDRESMATLYQSALCVMLFLALPWLQVRLQQPGGWASWSQLYNQFWRNGITLLLSGLLVLLLWGVLALWAGLFRLLDIAFFERLFFSTPWFAWVASCSAAAAGASFCRERQRAIDAVRQVLTLSSGGLLPLLALMSLLFLATLPFVGLGSVSRHISCNALLNTLMLMLLIAASLVWHPQRETRPWPRWLDGVVRLALLLSPVYALLAAWSLWVRVAQYGWTPQRFYAALITVLVLVWALGYALTLLRQIKQQSLRPDFINRLIAGLALLLLVSVHTPLLDPLRISVNSQMERYQQGVLNAENVSLSLLKSTGRRGYQALRKLQNDPAFQMNVDRARQVNEMLDSGKKRPVAPLTVESLRQHIALADKGRSPEEAWWQMMVKQENDRTRACRQGSDSCILAALDLNGDGQDEWLLCQLKLDFCRVYGKKNGTWLSIGETRDGGDKKVVPSLTDAARSNKLTTRLKEWQDA